MPEQAAAQTQPDERAAAREFSYAAYRLRVTIKAAAPAMDQAAARINGAGCSRTTFAQTPKRARWGLSVVASEMGLGISVPPVAGAFGQFVHELDGVPTTDPALVDGRNAWRSAAELFAQVGPPPTDLCAQLLHWRATGYRDDAIPVAQPPAVHRALLTEGLGALAAVDRPEPRRASRRMQALGVPAGQAARFTGDALFEAIGD